MPNNNHFTFDKKIEAVEKASKNGDLTVGEIFTLLSGKGKELILIFLSLPFCQPLQIPGISTPFGLAIAFFGFRLAFGHKVWLPKRILEKKVSTHTLNVILEKTKAVMQKTRRWVHPRLLYLLKPKAMQIINSLLIAALGILLALPLPIPLSNLSAAWAIFFISFGMLEDDGLFVMLGYFLSLLTIGFFLAIVFSLKWIF